MDFKKLCRICLIKCEDQITYSVFSEDTILKISLCGGISIDKNRNLPEQICEQCFQNLENAHKFRITCQISEKRLNKLTRKLKDLITTNSATKQSFSFDQENLNLNIKLGNNKQIQNLSSKLESPKNELSDVESESNTIKLEIVQNDIKVKRKYIRNKCKEKNPEIKIVNDKLTCQICQVGYKAKNAFIYHMRRHRNEMDFICEICGSAFETNFKLSRHLLQHTGTKKYPCRTCDIAFPTSSNRDRHERRLHTTIRPFQCEYCIKVFAYSDQLKNHIRIHTGEKPFICDKCGTGFRRKSHLITHKKAITPCFLKNKEKNEVKLMCIDVIKPVL